VPGADSVSKIIMPDMSEVEIDFLDKSAKTIREAAVQ